MSRYTRQVDKAKSHSVYRHYTSVDSFLKILENRTLRLSALAEVNDPIEEDRIDSVYRNKVFVSCFSHTEKESIPMWKIYGENDAGICLEFRSLGFSSKVENYDLGVKEKWMVRKIALIDVIYTDDLDIFTRRFDPLKLNGNSRIPTQIGCVKSRVWKYEEETRIRVYVDVPERTTASNRFYWDKKENVIRDIYPDFKYIMLKLDDTVLDEITIRFNPFMCKETKAILQSGIISNYYFIREHQFVDSELTGKIKL